MGKWAETMAMGALVAVLAGCGAATEADLKPKATSSAKASGAPTGLTEAQKKKIREANGLPETPNAKNQAAFIAALNAIDPDIVHGKVDKAVSRSKDVCSSVKRLKNQPAKVLQQTALRYTSPAHPEGRTPAQAKLILQAARKYICPTF